MIKLIIQNFKITNKSIILATPMVLFMFLTILYLNFIVTHARTVNLAFMSLITLMIMISGFLAGWLYMVKKTLQLSGKVFVYENDRIKALKQLMMSIPNGVGKYFLSFLGFIIISMLITVIFYHLSVGLIPADVLNKITDILFFKNQTETLLFIISSVLSFFGMLWIPEIVYKEKNSIKALTNSLLKTFKTFPKTLGLYIFIYIIYIGTNFSAMFVTTNPLLVFVLLIIYYYFLLYAVLLVFRYYEQTFLKQN